MRKKDNERKVYISDLCLKNIIKFKNARKRGNENDVENSHL
jgi:hypothetical protein